MSARAAALAVLLVTHLAGIAPARVWVAQSAAASSGSAHYEDAKRAITRGDRLAALSHFEQALLAEPDNLRYGSEYRQTVIQVKEYDRCLSFFESLVAKHPEAPNAYLNYGFAYVDKIPDAGAVSQLLLATKALPLFTKALEMRPTWLAYATRGSSYLFWPKVFGKTPLAMADLEQALKIQQTAPPKSYHVRTYISFGDGFWKLDELDKARATWRDGLARFSDNALLKSRLAAASEDELRAIVLDTYDPNKRIDTNLEEFLEK